MPLKFPTWRILFTLKNGDDFQCLYDVYIAIEFMTITVEITLVRLKTKYNIWRVLHFYFHKQ